MKRRKAQRRALLLSPFVLALSLWVGAAVSFWLATRWLEER